MERDRSRFLCTTTSFLLEFAIQQTQPMKIKYTNLLGLLVVFSIMASLALCRTGHLWGHDFRHSATGTTAKEYVKVMPDGSMTVNTSDAGKNSSGYAGPVPLEIHISNGKIDSVTALENLETPAFFQRVADAGLLRSWDGMSLSEAATVRPDAVSGATFSSNAVIENMHKGIDLAMDAEGAAMTIRHEQSAGSSLPRAIIVMAVVLAGAVIPLVSKNRHVRTVQQILNAGVLGFWAGTFIDFTNMIDFAASGPRYSMASVTLLVMLIVAFFYPLFGRHAHYCNHICPLGSLQELASHIPTRKIRISPKTSRMLEYLREILFSVLILLLWTGIGTEWINHELFTAFIVESASLAVIITGIAFIILSIFIPRPFCRFVCPTGTLLKSF